MKIEFNEGLLYKISVPLRKGIRLFREVKKKNIQNTPK